MRVPPEPRGPLNDLIAQGMKRLGLDSLGEFADHAGIGRATLYNLVQGRVSINGTWVKPSLDTIFALSRALDVPAEELVRRFAPEDYDMPPPSDLLHIPIVGLVGAGPAQNGRLEDSIGVSKAWARGRDLVAFEIRGDSMDGGQRPIPDGAIVIIDQGNKGQSGSAVVARLRDGMYVCKALKLDRWGSRLVSANALHSNGTPTEINLDAVDEICGKVVRVVKDLDGLDS